MKKIFFILILLNFFLNVCAYSSEVYVVLKINNNVITNIDIDNEYRYLIALSPSLQDVDRETIMKIAKDSIIREKIKQGELNKHFDMEVENKFIEKILSDFYSRMGMNSIKEFTTLYISQN